MFSGLPPKADLRSALAILALMSTRPSVRLTTSAEEWALSQWRRDDPGIHTVPLMALGIAAGLQTALVVRRKHLNLMTAVNFSVGCLLRQLSDEKAFGDDDGATQDDL